MPIELEVDCEKCGEPLTAKLEWNRGMPHISVDPCPTCLSSAEVKARTEGYERGYVDGEKGS